MQKSDEQTPFLITRQKIQRFIPFFVLIMLLLSVVTFGILSVRSQQELPKMPIGIGFLGEYSQNGKPWNTLTEHTRFNALEGELKLRGKFSFECEKTLLHVYLDNISIFVKVDGMEEYYYKDSEGEQTESAGNQWKSWMSRSFDAKEVEITLSNSKMLGNPRAYNEFLDNLYVGANDLFESYILYPSDYFSVSPEYSSVKILYSFLLSGQFWRIIGYWVLIISFIPLGIAFADHQQKGMFGRKLWMLGLLTMLTAGVMILDTIDVSLRFDRMIFNVAGAQICRMLWMLLFTVFLGEIVTGWRKNAAYAAAIAGSIFDIGIFYLVLSRDAYLTDLIPSWIIVQAIICLVLFVVCSIEFSNADKKRMLVTLFFLLCAVMVELVNTYFGFLQRGVFVHSSYLVFVIVYLVWALKIVPKAFRAAKRLQEQEKELIQNRISITISQIQPHFLYNSLNSIRYLCKKDPNAAQKAVDDFATYLRGNMDSLKRSTPVPFIEEVKHLEIYLSLEKMRFDEELNIAWDIQTTSFFIPSLTVQPLVENAVKYGVGKKIGGGTVTISAVEHKDHFAVVVKDDGVGFDMAEKKADGRSHIGIDNVRSRLQAMCQASLTIESTPGVGTTATIRIPKEEKNEHISSR